MSMADFASMLTELARDYYEQRLTVQDYRAQRRTILDRMDGTLNGAKYPVAGSVAGPGPVPDASAAAFSGADDAGTEQGEATTRPGIHGMD